MLLLEIPTKLVINIGRRVLTDHVLCCTSFLYHSPREHSRFYRKTTLAIVCFVFWHTKLGWRFWKQKKNLVFFTTWRPSRELHHAVKMFTPLFITNLLFYTILLFLFADRKAFVTLATTDAYALGALVLGRSLRRVGTANQLCVMVTNNLSQNVRWVKCKSGGGGGEGIRCRGVVGAGLGLALVLGRQILSL